MLRKKSSLRIVPCNITLKISLSYYVVGNSVLGSRACLNGGGGPERGEVACGGSAHLSCKRDFIRMRDYMDRRVTTT